MLPDHKYFFVVQGSKGFYIQHTCPFDACSSESNAGSIVNGAMDIWKAGGVKPSVKWVDDLNIFCSPVGVDLDGAYIYLYDMKLAKAIIAALCIPWHSDKWSDFAEIFTYIGFKWDIKHCMLSSRRKTVEVPLPSKILH